jgi:hypothetical protein
MLARSPSPSLFLHSTLDAARRGGATLVGLAQAHEIAVDHKLHSVIAELRRHIRSMVPDPNDGRTRSARDILLGVGSGIVTHYALKAAERGR